MVKLGSKQLNGDGVGFVERYDFSSANFSYENRVATVSTVASVCYGNDDKPNFNIYDKLLSESLGLPSSSFEFVPVLLTSARVLMLLDAVSFSINTTPVSEMIDTFDMMPKCLKYGIGVRANNQLYYLTNLRALLEDAENLKSVLAEDIKEWYNTDPAEIKVIQDNFMVFKSKITLRTTRQLVRHRNASYQELSRRYTSAAKVPFEFYSEVADKGEEFNPQEAIKLYDKLIDLKVPKEEARDVLPPSLYTAVWNAWNPAGLNSFINLRVKKSAQLQIRNLAEAMQELRSIKCES